MATLKHQRHHRHHNHQQQQRHHCKHQQHHTSKAATAAATTPSTRTTRDERASERGRGLLAHSLAAQDDACSFGAHRVVSDPQLVTPGRRHADGAWPRERRHGGVVVEQLAGRHGQAVRHGLLVEDVDACVRVMRWLGMSRC